ncbi:integrase core domain-containing protein [Lachnospiraceae bacterium ZAX-1]
MTVYGGKMTLMNLLGALDKPDSGKIVLGNQKISGMNQKQHTLYRRNNIVKDKNLRQSMSRRGNCWDNAPQESFYGHMKDEIDLSRCETYVQVKAVIDDWMDYYNRERYQWQLSKLSPDEYYQYITTGKYPLTGIKQPEHIN